MKMTLLHPVAFFLAVFLTTVSCPGFAETAFKVCADPLNPPYSTQAQDGFENKIAELFAKRLGQTLVYTWFPQRIGFLRNTLTAPMDEKSVDSKDFKCDVVMGMPEGSDMVLTTQPYYSSTYVLLIAQGRGWDDITDPRQLVTMPLQRQETLRIAMFDRGPGTEWLQKHDLLGQGVPYQSMSGDAGHNIAMQLDADFKAKKIDMAILWGPIASYLITHNQKHSYRIMAMPQTPGIRFEYSMSMAVRNGDKERKAKLDQLIRDNLLDLQKILDAYQIPRAAFPNATGHVGDDE